MIFVPPVLSTFPPIPGKQTNYIADVWGKEWPALLHWHRGEWTVLGFFRHLCAVLAWVPFFMDRRVILSMDRVQGWQGVQMTEGTHVHLI